jgi:hypothetical protein
MLRVFVAILALIGGAVIGASPVQAQSKPTDRSEHVLNWSRKWPAFCMPLPSYGTQSVDTLDVAQRLRSSRRTLPTSFSDTGANTI